MNFKRLMKVKDSNPLYGLCYSTSGYHSRSWTCEPLNAQDPDSAIKESANKIKGLRQELNSENIYIVDYSSKPQQLNGNEIYCIYAFKCKFHAFTGMGGYYTTDGIENENSWRYIDGYVTLW